MATRTQYLLKSFLVTCTYWSLITDPTQPLAVPRKLETPASRAKQVASMFLGVIFANRTDIGRKIKAMLSTS